MKSNASRTADEWGVTNMTRYADFRDAYYQAVGELEGFGMKPVEPRPSSDDDLVFRTDDGSPQLFVVKGDRLVAVDYIAAVLATEVYQRPIWELTDDELPVFARMLAAIAPLMGSFPYEGPPDADGIGVLPENDEEPGCLTARTFMRRITQLPPELLQSMAESLWGDWLEELNDAGVSIRIEGASLVCTACLHPWPLTTTHQCAEDGTGPWPSPVLVNDENAVEEIWAHAH